MQRAIPARPPNRLAEVLGSAFRLRRHGLRMSRMNKGSSHRRPNRGNGNPSRTARRFTSSRMSNGNTITELMIAGPLRLRNLVTSLTAAPRIAHLPPSSSHQPRRTVTRA